MIKREITPQLLTRLQDHKAIILMGPRQVGKTTLFKHILADSDGVLWLSGDESDVRALFAAPTSSRLKALFGKSEIVVIDEAQRIDDVGIKLKLICDQIPEVKLLATGSSSFELANKISESLAGRKWEFLLYPLSFQELADEYGLLEELRLLNHRLVYGSYPEVVTNSGDEAALLKEITSSALYKDVLAHEGIKNSDKLERLLQALAYQIASLISYHELGQICGLDQKTVERYINILEHAYIVFRVGSFSANLRNELKKSRKVYFYDNGIRNTLIADFRPAETRTDIGQLWENYLMSERRKLLANQGKLTTSRFWRTAQKQEIDLVEIADGRIDAYEFKWNPEAKPRGVTTFTKAYPQSSFTLVNPRNYTDFLKH